MSDRNLVRMTLLPTLCWLAALAAAGADSPPPNPAPARGAGAPPQAPATAQAQGTAAAAGEPDMNALADQALAQVKGRLKLTDEQATKIKPLLVDHLGKVRQIFKDYGDPSGVSFPALSQEYRAQRARFKSSLAPILAPAQRKEADVIRTEVDRQLRDTICNERVAVLKGPLSLTADQEASVRPILCEDFDKKREVISMLTARTGGPAARRTATPEIQSIQSQTEARLRQVLSADQMKAYEAYRDKLRSAAQPGR
jgi:hypothetical protein